MHLEAELTRPLLLLLQDSDEDEDEDEDAALQSGSEGTSSEPRDDHTDASSVEVTSSRPRRSAALRRASSTNRAALQQATEGRRRSTRSASAYGRGSQYQPPQDPHLQVESRHVALARPLTAKLIQVLWFPGGGGGGAAGAGQEPSGVERG